MVCSFVILHYGDVSVTDACVKSILGMDGQERIRIVVADNDTALPMEKRKKLQDMYAGEPRIKVLPILEPRGFSYANNLGYQYARDAQGAGCIIVCNNDIVFPQQDFLSRLGKSLSGSQCHILGPDIVRQWDGEHQNPMDFRLRTADEARHTIRLNRLALRFYPAAYPFVCLMLKKGEKEKQKRKLPGSYQNRQEGIVPFGACLVFAPAFVGAEAEAFSPETRFFYEEYLLALRCRENGYRITYDPSLKVLHESGAATAKTYRTEKARVRFMLERTAEACSIYLDTLEKHTSPKNKI